MSQKDSDKEIEVKMRQCIKLGLGFLPLFLATVILFQNCGEQGKSSSALASQAFKSTPFAYDATIDTMAYMSCSEMNSSYDPRAFFSFKVGAYTSGAGLMLNSAFNNAMKYYPTRDRLTALQNSDANEGAWLQVSLRAKTDYQTIKYSGSGPEPEKDYYSFLQNLDSNEVANVLLGLSSGARAAYFSSISDTSSRFMEGSLRFLGSEGIATSIRQQATAQQAVLALTYTSKSDPEDTQARTPIGSTGNKAYGSGYMMTFNNDTGVTSNTVRILETVREMDLSTGATAGGNIRTWTCPTSLRFMIVRREDVTANANSPCDTPAADNATTYQDQQILQIVRRVLPVDYYSVDLVKRCIVAKTPIQAYSCYGTRANNAPAIAYRSATCDATNCPHYVSICTRQ